MTYQDKKFAEVENVGFVDCVVRGSASIAILVAVMLLPSITALTLFGLTQLAIYAGLTAFLGWDPVYAMMRYSETQQPAQVHATVTSYPQREAQVSGGKHSKAA
jgi:hypothetical protein